MLGFGGETKEEAVWQDINIYIYIYICNGWKYNIKVGIKNKIREIRSVSSNSGSKRVAGLCQHDNEPSGFVKCGEFLQYTYLWK